MRIIIVDDDNLVAMSLQTILETDEEIDVVDVGHNGEDAVKLFDKYKPDVVLMDIRMNGMNGLEAAEKILKKNQYANILLLTTFSDDEYIIKALNIGTRGYILKQDFESIIPAIKAVNKGQSVFGGEVVAKIPLLMSTDTKTVLKEFDLSEKEMSIMEQVAKGFNNKEIADILYLSEGTVRNYISNILDKLALRDRTQLAIFYLTHR